MGINNGCGCLNLILYAAIGCIAWTMLPFILWIAIGYIIWILINDRKDI